MLVVGGRWVCLGCGLSLRQLWLSKEKRGQWGRWDRELVVVGVDTDYFFVEFLGLTIHGGREVQEMAVAWADLTNPKPCVIL